MSDDDLDVTPVPAPSDDGREWRAESGGGGREPERPRNAGRWVRASTGHLVCVEPARL